MMVKEYLIFRHISQMPYVCQLSVVNIAGSRTVYVPNDGSYENYEMPHFARGFDSMFFSLQKCRNDTHRHV